MQTLTVDRPIVKTHTPCPPTHAELAARIAVRHPRQSTMAARALAIVETGKVRWTGEDIGEADGTNGERYLIWFSADGPRCSCPSWRHRPAIINGRHYCKHIMALAIQGAK